MKTKNKLIIFSLLISALGFVNLSYADNIGKIGRHLIGTWSGDFRPLFLADEKTYCKYI